MVAVLLVASFSIVIRTLLIIRLPTKCWRKTHLNWKSWSHVRCQVCSSEKLWFWKLPSSKEIKTLLEFRPGSGVRLYTWVNESQNCHGERDGTRYEERVANPFITLREMFRAHKCFQRTFLQHRTLSLNLSSNRNISTNDEWTFDKIMSMAIFFV